MMIIGCDYHLRYQQIAMMDMETGEMVERRLEHENGEARIFYARLPKPVLVGMEATGYAPGFERMLAEFGHELWIGHASEIRAGVVRKQKTDARDALAALAIGETVSANLDTVSGRVSPRERSFGFSPR